MNKLQVKEDYYTNQDVVELYDYRRFVRGGGALVAKSEIDSINDMLNEISFEDNSVAIDCPTGSGRFIPLLNARGYKVVACDISKPMLELAMRYKANQYLECGADSIPIASGTANLVLMSRFCFHFKDPSPFICEMARVLKDDGYLLADFYNWTPRRFLPDFLYGGKTFTHNKAEVQAIAKKYGFEIVKVKALFFLPPYVYSLLPLRVTVFVESFTEKHFPRTKSKTYYLLKKGG